jgi:UDP-N-acetylmuramate dehydrogenase
MNMAETKNFQRLRGVLKRDEPMSRHVSWRAGGRARQLYVPADVEDLCVFLLQLAAEEPILALGLGSNLLVRDGGFAGTVILLHAASLHAKMEDRAVYAAAGVAAPKVARFAAVQELQGAEFLAGIPGTVGGALAMNAGCYGGETWQIVDRVQTVDRTGRLRVRAKGDYDIGYRHCQLRERSEEWFVAAWFALRQGDGQASRERIRELLAKRIASQPLSLPNAGSVFRNPPNGHAARLIEDCGLKGLERGGARVSEKHANFIVNPAGAASAADIEWLIHAVRDKVKAATGVELVPEVRIVGEAA